jgi:hypothetical protein
VTTDATPNAHVDVRYHPTARALLEPADRVKPYAQNARMGDTDLIVQSILRNGCYRPIYAWTKTGEILAGNHTYAALLELGQEQVPVAWVDAETMDEARRIVLVDNKAGMVGGFDEGLLIEELRALEGDYDGTGYVQDDLDGYIAMADDDAWDHPDNPGRGDPDEESFLPRIDLRVTSQMFDGWRRLLDQYEGEDDRTKLHAHLSAGGFLDV